MGMTSRCDDAAADGVRRLVQQYGWLSVLRGIALAKPKSINTRVVTPEYVTEVYENWVKCERPDSRAGINGFEEDES